MLINIFNSDFVYIDKMKDYLPDILYFEHESSESVIPIMVNTSGGTVAYAWNLHSAFQICKKPVVTFTFGMALSAGALILASGTKGFRFATETSELMLHRIVLDDDSVDSSTEKLSKLYLQTMDNLCNQKPGHFEKALNRTIKKELRYVGTEIKKHGFVDHTGFPIIEITDEGKVQIPQQIISTDGQIS